MYKIYINENKLLLTDSQSVRDEKKTKGKLLVPYSGKTKMLLSYIDMMEKTNRFKEVIIHHANITKLKKDFNSLFKIIRAAGGVVNDGEDNILFIYRRGCWDLPKGKIDKGEKKKEAALREVEEETGITNITIGKKIKTTRHTYRTKDGKRAIKKTFWYEMSAPHQKLIPQKEEDITKAEWIPLKKVTQLKGKVFKNIKEVSEAYLSRPLIV